VDVERTVDTCVRDFSRLTSLDRSSIGAVLPDVLWDGHHAKALAKSLLARCRQYRHSREFAKLRASMSVGTIVLGLDFLTKGERTGILLSDGVPAGDFGRFLSRFKDRLATADDEGLLRLRDRLETYGAYCSFETRLRSAGSQARAILRNRPRSVIKGVLALVQVFFLRKKLGFPFGDDFEEVFAEFLGPEELASVASLLVALANEHNPLDSLDFAMPLESAILTDDVRCVIAYGREANLRYETSRLISLFGYQMKQVHDAEPIVFTVRPPWPEFEYASRLGNIRAELGAFRPKDIEDRDKLLSDGSLATLAERFAADFNNIAEVVDRGTPLQRIRLRFPIIPDLYQKISDTWFYEDMRYQDQLSPDFLVPLRLAGESELRLTDRLTLRAFLRLWRLCNLWPS
jgi:hypothetical protein